LFLVPRWCGDRGLPNAVWLLTAEVWFPIPSSLNLA
jgi:hypothetical protein